MSEVGALIVKLRAETASFREDMGKVKAQLNDLDPAAKKAGEAIDFSMVESRGAVVLLGEQFGVHAPREISRMIATIPGIGMALSALLPIMGAVWAVEKIYSFIKASQEAREALAKGWENANHGIENHIDDLKLSIEKYKQLISVLEGKAPTNGAALALAAARVEADKLSDSILKDISDLNKLMEKSAQSNVWLALTGGTDTKQAIDVAKGLQDAIAKIPHDSHFATNMQKAIKDSWQRAQSEIEKNKADAAATPQQDGTDYNGVAGKDYTKADEALQQYQQHLSELYNQEDLTQQDDSLKGKVEVLKKSAEAARKAAESEKALAAITRELAEANNKFREISAASVFQSEKEVSKELSKDLSDVAAKTLAYVKALKELGDNQRTSKQLQTISDLKMQGDAIKQQHDLRLMDEATYAAQMKAQLEKEAKAEKAFLQQTVDDYAAQASSAAQRGDSTTETLALANKVKAQEKLNEVTNKYTAEIMQMDTALQKANASWSLFFKQQQGGTQNAGADIRKNLQESMQKFEEQSVHAFAQSMVEGKNFGAAMRQIAAQMLEQMIEHTMMTIILDDKEKLSAAETAGAKAFAWASGWGGPVAGAIAAAAAFAGAMAFEQGGEIPGSGAVPIIGHGGETVVTKALTDQVKNSSTTNNKGGDTHVHIHAQAMDSEGMDRVLKKHGTRIARHVANHARMGNK